MYIKSKNLTFSILLHLLCVNIYKQDFPHSHSFGESAPACTTYPKVFIQKLILQSSRYYKLINQNIEAGEVLQCGFLCIFSNYEVVFLHKKFRK